jgi:hypothetical protein
VEWLEEVDMLRIKIELVPFGIESGVRSLGEMKIVNDGTGGNATGNYNVTLFNKAGKKWKTGRVEGFKRREYTAWRLLHLALNALFGKEEDDEEHRPTPS